MKIIKWLISCIGITAEEAESLMHRNLPRSEAVFFGPYVKDSLAHKMASKAWKILISRTLIPHGTFSAHLLDNLENDYAIDDDDIEDILHEMLDDYDLPRKVDEFSDMCIITAKDLIEFATMVARKYPLKESKGGN